MNRRIHLMMRIDRVLKRTTDPVIKQLLQDTHRVLEADEDEITDLESRIDALEREFNKYPPYSPDDE